MNEIISSIGIRIKELRNELDLSQSDFGEKLGVKRDVVNNLERGRNKTLNEPLLKAIITEFNVNENWLRTGEGEMFNEVTKDDLLTTALANAINDNDMFLQGFITTYDKLPEDGKKLITNFIKELANVANLCEEEESNKKEED